MKQTVNVLTVSGGKDSTAMWICAVKELGIEVLPVFCDTGNEHHITYQYINYLEKELGPVKRIKPDFTERIAKKAEYVRKHWPKKLQQDVPGCWMPTFELDSEEAEMPTSEPPDPSKSYRGVYGWEWVPGRKGMTPEEAEAATQRAIDHLKPTGNPFLDLCIWKSRFPSTKVRFCTQYLKAYPIFDEVYAPLLEQGYHVVSWQGVRAAESPARAKLQEREMTPEGYEIYRPLLQWSARDVFAMHKKHGIEPNPLYLQGMGRVGCMPCINVNKDELFEISRRFPEEIERIAEWERIVSAASKLQNSSFLPALASDDKKNIYDWVEWSKTAHGGKQYDLIKAIEFDNVPVCSSQYGLCE
ncbi:phosphoadenosine phosphosulfate reductase domain-containing protein [Paenibacillus ehimensis]|uniref:phosphoadenosine phosphosulfate reductase domain-containing protein n=1 Tax=Paenibacillus ehimensis TaxID=79264 RepID=UPI000FD74291|nr:phosphoadenosine phosphosulfate reductase family protein [Paenibacillus ehimensis]